MSIEPSKFNLKQIKGLNTDSDLSVTLTNINTSLSSKASSSDFYSKSEIDTSLSSKANTGDFYTKSEIDTSLSSKANTGDFYTKSEIDTSLSSKANTGDFYTKSEIDSMNAAYITKVTDDFDNFDLIDISSTSNIKLNSDSSISAAKTESVIVDVNNIQSEFDQATKSDVSFNVAENAIVLASNEDSGYFQSKIYPAANISQIQVGVNYEHQTINGFGNQANIQLNKVTGNYEIACFTHVVDDAERVWYFYQTTTGRVYMTIINNNNDKLVENVELSQLPDTSTSTFLPLQTISTVNDKTMDVIFLNDSGYVILVFEKGFGGSIQTDLTEQRIVTYVMKYEDSSVKYFYSNFSWGINVVPYDNYLANESHVSSLCIKFISNNNTVVIVFYAGGDVFLRNIGIGNNSGKHTLNGSGSSGRNDIETIVAFTSPPTIRCQSIDEKIYIMIVNSVENIYTSNSNRMHFYRFNLTSSNLEAKHTTIGAVYPANLSSTSSEVTINDEANKGFAEFFVKNNLIYVFYPRDFTTVTSLNSSLGMCVVRATLPTNFTNTTNLTVIEAKKLDTWLSPTHYKLGNFSTSSYYDDQSNFFYFLFPQQQGEDFNSRTLVYFKTSLTNSSFVWDFFNRTVFTGGYVMPNMFPKFKNETDPEKRTISIVAHNHSNFNQVILGPDTTKIIVQARSLLVNGSNIEHYGDYEIIYDDKNTIKKNNFNNPIDLDNYNSVQLKINLYSSTSITNTPKIKGYTLNCIEVDTNPIEGYFTTNSLISNKVIKKVFVHVDTQPSNSDQVKFQISTNGGAYFSPTQYTISQLATGVDTPQGTNLKLRGHISVPSGQTSAKINKYTAIVNEAVVQSDLFNVQINMMKLGLQITALQYANRYSYNNMMIDLLNPNGASQYTIDPEITISGGVATATQSNGTANLDWEVHETDKNIFPTSIIIVAETEGSIVFSVKRNNEATWQQITLDQLTLLSGNATAATLPEKNRIYLRASFSPNAKLFGIAYLYS